MTDKDKATLTEPELSSVTGGANETQGVSHVVIGAACPYCGCPNFSCDTQGKCTCLACGKSWY